MNISVAWTLLTAGMALLVSTVHPAAVYATDAVTQDPALTASSSLIQDYIDPFIKVLSGLVGIIVTISIIVAGIQYSMAADDTRKITAAKARIEKALIALLAYILLLAFLQWLIPGGIA